MAYGLQQTQPSSSDLLAQADYREATRFDRKKAYVERLSRLSLKTDKARAVQSAANSRSGHHVLQPIFRRTTPSCDSSIHARRQPSQGSWLYAWRRAMPEWPVQSYDYVPHPA